LCEVRQPLDALTYGELVSTPPAQQHHRDEEQALILEDVDLADDTELRRIAAEVESLVAGKTRGLRVSPLSMEQWETVIGRLPAWLRRGQQHHLHVLPDRREPQHLLVSPVAVQGLNQASRVIYHEVVSSLVRAIPTPLKPNTIRKGLNEILIEACGRKLGVDLFARTYPAEAEFVRTLLKILARDFGHSELDWALVLRRNPDRCLLALRKTEFCRYWLHYAKQDPSTEAALRAAGNKKRHALTDLICAEEFTPSSPLGRLTLQAALTYLNSDTRNGARA
jgi:hypothetical protein